jgi:RNA polymerase sigma-70 factor (ECF subfamily)
VLQGDRAAGERLVAAHYPRVFRLLRSLAGEGDAAQDLTQQTFARAWQSLSTFQGRSGLATWLNKIAYHEYTHWLRARRIDAPLDEAAAIEDLREARGLDSILVSRALTLLSTDLRETFVLYYMQEFSIAEVAGLLDVPAGTVKSRLFAARQRMRELLQAADARAVPEAPSDGPVHLLFTSAEGSTRL